MYCPSQGKGHIEKLIKVEIRQLFGLDMFDVTQDFTMEKFVVDFKDHTCTCYFQDLVGIPCRRVVFVINYKSKQPKDYVHRYYKRNSYKTCYKLWQKNA